MTHGECNCGAVAFDIEGDLEGIVICHCSICRRATGANGIAVVVIDNAAFTWQRGQDNIQTWQKPGHDWKLGFCRTCGSPMPGENDGTRLFVPAGTLTAGAEHLDVIHHIWVDSRANWDVIGDQGRQHPEHYRSDS